MVAGHLREQNGFYQIVLSFNDALGKRKTKSISTGLSVKGNKRRAEALLLEARQNFDNGVSSGDKDAPGNILFTDFMLEWLELMKNCVEITTYANYAMVIKSRIVPYFKQMGLTLSELTPKHIQDYYLYGLNVEKVSANTVIHRHANIRKALQYALRLGLIDFNPATGWNVSKRTSIQLQPTTKRNWKTCFPSSKASGSNLPLSSVHSTVCAAVKSSA